MAAISRSGIRDPLNFLRPIAQRPIVLRNDRFSVRGFASKLRIASVSFFVFAVGKYVVNETKVDRGSFGFPP